MEASDPDNFEPYNVEIGAVWQDEDILNSLSRIQLKNTKYKIELTHMELHVDKIIFKIFLCACGLLKNENSTIIP